MQKNKKQIQVLKKKRNVLCLLFIFFISFTFLASLQERPETKKSYKAQAIKIKKAN